jgi:hypothetical protein
MSPVCGESCLNAHRIGGTDAPCETCRKEPSQQNADAYQIFLLVQNQVIVAGMGDILDLSFPAVQFAMDLYGIRNQRECFEKVKYLFDTVQRIRREKK